MALGKSREAVWVGGALALASMLGSVHAHADGASNPAVAEALYEEARGLMKQGKVDQACPKFKQSYDLDPGGGTLLNLAECYEKQGKFASAWSTFKEAQVTAQRDGRRERVEYAKKHIAAIEPKLSKITIIVTSDASTPGLSVMLDGAELGAAAWGVGVPVDPGPHELSASAPNKASYQQHVDVSSATAATTLTIPQLADVPVAAPPPQLVDEGLKKMPVPSEPSVSNGSKTLGYVLVGAGVVGIGIGSYFGLRAFSKWSERKDDCVGGCTNAAKSAGDDAKSAALLSDVGFGVGVIAAGVGTYLLLSSKHSSELSSAKSVQLLPVVAAGGCGLWLRGSY